MSTDKFRTRILTKDETDYVRVNDVQATLVDKGEYFGTSPLIQVSSGVTDYMLIRTNGRMLHGSLQLIATGAFIVGIRLGATVTADGTAVSVNNFNQTSPNVSTVEAYTGTTVSATGTLLTQYLVPGGSGPQSVGSDVTARAKFVLPANTEVLVAAQNLSNQPERIQIRLNFYESDVA